MTLYGIIDSIQRHVPYDFRGMRFSQSKEETNLPPLRFCAELIEKVERLPLEGLTCLRIKGRLDSLLYLWAVKSAPCHVDMLGSH